MTEPRPSGLSERQKEVLRLVFQNYDAKQIARALGISPHTVNDHMRAARRTLGVARTMDAARILANDEYPNRVGTDPIGIDPQLKSSDGANATPPDETAVVRKDRYCFGFLARLGIIVALAFGVVAATGALIEVSDVITHLLEARHIDLSDAPPTTLTPRASSFSRDLETENAQPKEAGIRYDTAVVSCR